jgi:hypothetical protein
MKLARNVSRTRAIRNSYSIVAEYPKGKRLTEGFKHTCRLEDNIKMDRRESGSQLALLMLRQLIQDLMPYAISY